MLNDANVSLFDNEFYVLRTMIVDDTSPGVNSAEYFRAPVKAGALVNTIGKQFNSMYKYIKINHVTCYLTLYGLSYDLSTTQSSTSIQQWEYNAGVSQLFGKFPFYISWDVDGVYPNKLSGTSYEDDIHSKKLYLHGNSKPVKFKYTVPDPVRRYLTTSEVFKSSIKWRDDQLGDNLVKISGLKNFRCPMNFNGGCTDVFSKLDNAIGDRNHNLPLKFVLNVKTYVNVSYKGRVSVP